MPAPPLVCVQSSNGGGQVEVVVAVRKERRFSRAREELPRKSPRSTEHYPSPYSWVSPLLLLSSTDLFLFLFLYIPIFPAKAKGCYLASVLYHFITFFYSGKVSSGSNLGKTSCLFVGAIIGNRSWTRVVGGGYNLWSRAKRMDHSVRPGSRECCAPVVTCSETRR